MITYFALREILSLKSKFHRKDGSSAKKRQIVKADGHCWSEKGTEFKILMNQKQHKPQNAEEM